MNGNFVAALAFVWRPGLDSPADGYHVTPGDPGGGTFAGVIEATWQKAVQAGIVRGRLKDARTDDLSRVLRVKFWDGACEFMPPGVDLVLFNGIMMTGRYKHLFQQCCGFTGEDVDGSIGPQTILLARDRDPVTLIAALTGVHFAYLASLDTWAEFGGGWTKRLLAASAQAIGMAKKGALTA